jgi:hypothetical protein
MKQIQAEGLELFIRKNADYGDSYKQYGLIGVLVRLQDKINRCLNITKNGISVKDESLRDTLIDLHNYAAMALMESESEPTVPNLPIRTCRESEPAVPNLPIRTYCSEPPSEYLSQSQTRVRRSLSDPPDAMRANEMDRCINLR